MLGILVALVKIAELARVNAGVGIFCVGALTLLYPAIIVNFDSREVWSRLKWADTRELEDAPHEAAGGGS